MVVNWTRRERARPQLPGDVRLYVIGDIHGRSDLLDRTLNRIADDLKDKRAKHVRFVFLGDYVDRGPDSSGVLDRLVEFRAAYDTVCLKGNHEAFLLEFLSDPLFLEEWGRYGGITTLTSYGLRPSLQPSPAECRELAASIRDRMPPAHLSFLLNLPLQYVLGDFFFVHAGVRPQIPLDQQQEEDLLWIRDDFLLDECPYEKMIVHGHTPVLEPDIRGNRINIDTGAYATGRLTCLVLERNQVRLI